MSKILLAILQWLAPLVLAFQQGKQKAEVEHAREEKEAAINLANKLANRATSDIDAVNRLRRKAKQRPGPANDT